MTATTTPAYPKNLVNRLIDFESGYLDQAEIVALFVDLLNMGIVNHLQGKYGRTAHNLLAVGYITHKDGCYKATGKESEE